MGDGTLPRRGLAAAMKERASERAGEISFSISKAGSSSGKYRGASAHNIITLKGSELSATVSPTNSGRVRGDETGTKRSWSPGDRIHSVFRERNLAIASRLDEPSPESESGE